MCSAPCYNLFMMFLMNESSSANIPIVVFCEGSKVKDASFLSFFPPFSSFSLIIEGPVLGQV